MACEFMTQIQALKASLEEINFRTTDEVTDYNTLINMVNNILYEAGNSMKVKAKPLKSFCNKKTLQPQWFDDECKHLKQAKWKHLRTYKTERSLIDCGPKAQIVLFRSPVKGAT